MHHADTNQKKAEGALVISYKMNFRTKNIVSDKYDHFKIKKGSMNQENITILKDYAHNNKASKYIEIKNDITERRNSWIYIYSQRFQYLSLNSNLGRMFQAEEKVRKSLRVERM